MLWFDYADIFLRIPKSIYLLFYDFSTNYSKFSKFTAKKITTKLEINFRSLRYAKRDSGRTEGLQIGPWPD